MIQQARPRGCSLMTIVGVGVTLLAWSAGAEVVRLATPRFTLSFAADGRPASLKTEADGAEWLNVADPGPGLYLETRGLARVRFERLSLQQDRLIAAGPDGLPRITFAIHAGENHLAWRIERMEAVPASREVSLHLQLNLVEPVGLLELDYMTEVKVDHPRTISAQLERAAEAPAARNRAVALGRASVDWNHVWNRHRSNPLGGFALYCPRDAQDEDDTLLQIWTAESLPHPRVEGPWTLEGARRHVARWMEQHGDPSRFWIEASTPEELYAAVPYAEAARVRDVYLFTDTWRGEPFWARRCENWHVNRRVFPRGEADLRAFSDHLRERGMNLKIHWISGGIGMEDPIYVGKSPDPRLASWGSGQLVQPVGADDRTLLFRPDPGVDMPFRLPANEWWRHYTAPPMIHAVFDYELMRVGDELIRVGAFADTDREVWRLDNCQRGLLTTDPAGHAASDRVRGIITSYGQNFVPDNDSTLLGEMARNFAEFLNRCGVSHTEYDGAEIHTYNGRMWGYHKFASLVYENLDHPVTAFSSSGVAPPCYLEHRLNATRRRLQGRLKGIVPIMLDEPARPASTVLDAHWGLSQMCAHDYRFINLQKPEPLFGINVRTLQGHGRTDAILETVRNWKRVNDLVSTAQRRQIRDSLYFEDDPLAQAGHHEKSRVVHELVRGAGGWEIYPTAVLSRPGNVDIPWRDGQEHGAISPRQFLQQGTTLTLVNPFAAQPPRLILRVLWAFDAGTAAVGNLPLQPRVEEIRNRRDILIEGSGEALTLSATNPQDRSIHEEDAFPEWSRRLDLSRHRGLGLWVTGDASQAILLVQIPGGDYVVPLDFAGRRYVEIPNSQVAWSQGCWGWRMGAKHADYREVGWVKMGFGMLPAKSKSKVTVEKLTALRELESNLKNPVLKVGGGRLAIRGSISSGHYLTWEGGELAVVCDANWNKIAEIPVTADSCLVPAGPFEFRLEADDAAPSPWIELQLLARGPPILVADAEAQTRAVK